ncbi:hypothetical protein PPERSA_06341 [Pseudocohnilembus persalinus]|uniref:NAD(P)-binding domain n=1 Tax=Pseudocohnilembus persalinus TaxID=266149 RepID=A0A0V0QIT4_PSEPJ|nr:hypothetical protein PPERSA_06341 [Pseudocohnilembus persalinus]|eukprot:KRX02146.1 hypothetical protein PPERSA_06341 [Pseudocohnilembus persalinus]
MLKLKNPIYLAGFLYLSSCIYEGGECIYRYKYKEDHINVKDYINKDKTIIVTGGTQGLGKAFCESLAMKGFNLVVISRNAENLSNLKQNLEEQYHIKVNYIPFDLSTDSLEQYDKLFEELDKIKNFSGLINNAAILKQGNFGEINNQDLKTQITGNILAPTLLTNYFIKYSFKTENKDKNKFIINVGSQTTARGPVKSSQPYFATKEYMNYITDCLQQDQESVPNLYVQNLSPGYIDSPMLIDFSEKYKVPTYFQQLYIAQPKDLAEESLRQLETPILNGTFNQAFINSVLKYIPFTGKLL